MKKLFCPACEKELTITHQDRYESLLEHVSDPNGIPSLKDGYQCTDSECPANFLRFVWTDNGEYYYDYPESLDRQTIEKLIAISFKDGLKSPIGSWERGYEITEKKRKKYTLCINLYWIAMKMEPKFYQVFENIKPDEHKWKFGGMSVTWFKRDSKLGLVSFSPFWRIVKFKLREFHSNYDKALQKDRESIENLMKIYNDTAYWSKTQREDRFWYRAANFLIRNWYKPKFNIVKHLK